MRLMLAHPRVETFDMSRARSRSRGGVALSPFRAPTCIDGTCTAERTLLSARRLKQSINPQPLRPAHPLMNVCPRPAPHALQVAAFLQRHAGAFEAQPLRRADLEARGLPVKVLTAQGHILTLPHVHGVVDGSFAARFVRVQA